jgi:XRE family aerobic/anaerobic benzoate catabolism transcriptional regulator
LGATSLSDDAFLQGVGSRVRELRERRGLTRKAAAREADVSERYLGQLEAGEGNMSIVLLRRVTDALGAKLIDVLEPEQTGIARRHRVALIGLRGAGKSTLGKQLAADRGCRFVELDKEIERDSGLPLSELFSLYGQSGYRRLERSCLERLLADHSPMVLAAGGGVVAESDTFNLLLSNCYTIWLKASPEEHMARVIAQGDLRPMADNAAAMEDLKRILSAREGMYRKAEAVVDTAGQSAATSFRQLRDVLAV